VLINTPEYCPICGGPLEQITEVDSTVLVCPAADCPGKLLNKIDHFCSKKGMDIKGLSKSTIIKLMDWGWLDTLADLYHLHEHRAEWIQKPGFGVRSVDNILQAIEASRVSEYPKFLAAIGIPQIGTSMVKDIVMHPDLTNYDDFRAAVNKHWDFTSINGIGPEKAHSILTFDYAEADNVYKELTSLTSVSSNEITTSDMKNIKCFEGMTIVITGTLETFKNRSELVDFITERGGKVTGSVSKNTTILINNDMESNSSKNRDAKRLGVPILSEKKFLEDFLTF
jgi:DNA ligase (NAD+)